MFDFLNDLLKGNPYKNYVEEYSGEHDRIARNSFGDVGQAPQGMKPGYLNLMWGSPATIESDKFTFNLLLTSDDKKKVTRYMEIMDILLDDSLVEALGNPIVFCRTHSNPNVWTKMSSTLSGETFLEFLFDWRILNENSKPLSESALQGFVAKSKEVAESLGRKVILKEEVSVAARRAQKYAIVKEGKDYSVELILHLDSPLLAPEIYKTTLALGLHFGGDYRFHYVDPQSKRKLFTFFPLTEEGYFITGDGAKDISYSLLCFSFYFPVVPSPSKVFEKMIIATKNAQKMLGGKIINAKQKELTKEEFSKIKESIIEKEKFMEKQEVKPGENASLSIFLS